MKKKLFFTAVILFAALFAVSAFFLIRYYVQTGRSQKAYNELTQIKMQALEEAPSEAYDPETGELLPPALLEITDPNTGQTRLILPEYAPIYLMNPDTVGWIKVEGTNIDYPVLQRTDSKDYYLNRDFYGKWNSQGAIYAREQCDVSAPSDNVTVYGHNMKSGTMFAGLHKYNTKEFWQEHQYIQLDSLTERRTYQVMAVFSIDSTLESDFPYHLFVDAQEEQEFVDFVAQAKRYSLYDTGVTAQPGDKLITLSTCTGVNNVNRFVVVAKLVEE